MAGDKGKRILIHLSSDDDDDEDNCSESASSPSEYECDSIDDDDDDDVVYEVDDSEEDDRDDEDDDDDDDGEDDDDSFGNGGQEVGDDEDDEALYKRVIQYLQEKSDLRELSLKACKAYLRRHGLRVSGIKDECVERVQEHWRIKDGEAEVLYPRSSFIINCTGDVCKGDIVLFTQKVYGGFEKMTRRGKLLGKRTVAGRVVKESYGAAKQQHTFTVEVLWSKGIKKLQPLFPLLVKGRNLYRLKTYRQPWKNEAERRKVLAEKHKRGAIARLKRAKRKRVSSTDKGRKSQKVFPSTRPSQMSYSKRGKHVDRDKRAASLKQSTTVVNKQGAGAHPTKASCCKPFLGHNKLSFPEYGVSPSQSSSYHETSRKRMGVPVGSRHRSKPFETASEFQSPIPYHGPMMMHVAPYSGFSCRPPMTHAESWQSFPSLTMPGQRQSGPFGCSIQGCRESRSDRCVIAACWRCCRREGMRCHVHR